MAEIDTGLQQIVRISPETVRKSIPYAEGVHVFADTPDALIERVQSADLSSRELFGILAEPDQSTQVRRAVIQELADTPQKIYSVVLRVAAAVGGEVQILQEQTPFGYYSEVDILTPEQIQYRSRIIRSKRKGDAEESAGVSLLEHFYDVSIPTSRALTDAKDQLKRYSKKAQWSPPEYEVYEDLSAVPSLIFARAEVAKPATTIYFARAEVAKPATTIYSHMMTGRDQKLAEQAATEDLFRRLSLLQANRRGKAGKGQYREPFRQEIGKTIIYKSSTTHAGS